MRVTDGTKVMDGRKDERTDEGRKDERMEGRRDGKTERIAQVCVKIGFRVLRSRPGVRSCGGKGSYGVTGVWS